MSEAVCVKEEPSWDGEVANEPSESPAFEYGPIKIEVEFVKEEPVCVNQPLYDNTGSCSEAGRLYIGQEATMNLCANNETCTAMYTHERTGRYAGCMVKGELVLEPVSLPKPNMVPDLLSGGSHISSAHDLWKVNPKREAVSVKHLTYACDNCGKTFTQKRYLVQHMKVHKLKSGMLPKKRNHTCELCNKRFIQLGHLRAHTQSHTGRKPYSCNICQKMFTRLDTLTRHERFHAEGILKPYACEICNKKFAYPNSIKMHRLIKHTPDKLYACEICKKKFGTIGNLRRHVRIHSNEKPYACEVCERKFSDPTNLKQHKLTHTGNKSHCCVICTKLFLSVGQLNRHKRIHEGLKPFSCEVCNKRFTESGSLKKHRKKFHTSEVSQ